MSKRNTPAAKHARRQSRQAVAQTRPAAPAAQTREPMPPLPGWPGSHARVFLTDADEAECVGVEIHGITHYLHSTTAASLHAELGRRLREWNATATRFGGGVELGGPE